MKAFIGALVLLTSFNVFAATNACDQYVKDTEEIVLVIKDRFAVGEVTRTDIASSELAAVQAKFDCGLVTKADYCGLALPALEIYRAGVEEEVRIGMRTNDDLIRVAQVTFNTRRICK